MCRRLHTSSTDLTRSPGDLWVTIRRHSRKGYSYRTSRDRHKYANYPRARVAAVSSDPIHPTDSQPPSYHIYTTGNVLRLPGAALIAADRTSSASIGDENDRVQVQDDGKSANGRIHRAAIVGRCGSSRHAGQGKQPRATAALVPSLDGGYVCASPWPWRRRVALVRVRLGRELAARTAAGISGLEKGSKLYWLMCSLLSSISSGSAQSILTLCLPTIPTSDDIKASDQRIQCFFIVKTPPL